MPDHVLRAKRSDDARVAIETAVVIRCLELGPLFANSDNLAMLDITERYWSMAVSDPSEFFAAEPRTRRSLRPRGKKWTFMRTTRGSNFHDGEEFPAQSGAKQGSLKRRGSGFVSTGPPSVRLPKSPRGKPFPMTIEFRYAKVRPFPGIPRNRRQLDGNLFPCLPAGTLRRTATQPLRYEATDVLEGPENPFRGRLRKNGPSAKQSET